MKIDPAIDKIVYVKESPIHGKGVFARRDIARGDFIGSYEGPKARKDGTYVLWIFEEDGTSFGINGKNQLMYLNHSKKHNARFEGPDLYATKKIKKDQEIVFHYGEDWEDIS